MTKYFTLRFSSELEAIEIARRLHLLDNNQEIVSSMGHLGDIDEIGQVFKPAQYGENGEEIAAPVVISGYFINVAIKDRELPSVLEKYVVPYGNGYRVFAGTRASEDS